MTPVSERKDEPMELTATRGARARLAQRWTLRMIGQYVTLTGWQWLELHDLISSITDDGQTLRARIRERLTQNPDEAT